MRKLWLIIGLMWGLGAGPQVPAQIQLEMLSPEPGWSAPRASTFTDSTGIIAYLTDWRERSQQRAYWEASVDDLYRKDSLTYVATLHRGPAYRWAELRLPEGEPVSRWARKAGYRPRRFNNRSLSPEAWTRLRDSLLVRAANDGYPFASIGLEDIEWRGGQELAARIEVATGPRISVAELRVPDGVRVREVFLQRYLGLEPGTVYSVRKIRRLPARLAQLPYLSLRANPKITFRDSLAYLDLPLEKRSASRFDFVIGVLPNSVQNNGNLLITGELNGELYNGFGQGERIAARFEQLRPQTQELQVALDYPFLFGLPLGFEGELDLYRRDSSFLNLNWRLAATYLQEGNNRLSFFWQQRRTIVPGLDSAQLVNGQLPDTLGVSRSFFGLQLRRSRTDRRFSPRQGYALDLSAAAGFRRLRNVDFTGETADGLNERIAQYQLGAAADLYFDPLAGTVIYLGLRAAAIIASDPLLANEQYRVGGARLLRGFDEQELFATDYQVLTGEFRLLLGERAFLYAFIDAARLNPRSKSRSDSAIDYPLGLGAGVNFETRAGIFGLSLALGRRNGLPLDPGAPKVHLGYVSLF